MCVGGGGGESSEDLPVRQQLSSLLSKSGH